MEICLVVAGGAFGVILGWLQDCLMTFAAGPDNVAANRKSNTVP